MVANFIQIRTNFLKSQVVVTPLAALALMEADYTPDKFLRRHGSGDWEMFCTADSVVGDGAVLCEERILSSYTLHTGARVWVIRRADRSATMILLPEEYEN